MIFIPEIKINTDQLKKINNIWPMSGCTANNKAISKVNKNEKVRHSKLVVQITHDEEKLHKSFLKTQLKKNYF